MPFLKRFIFLFGVVILGLALNKVQAQADARTHFIYIQSEGQQPFYVILNKKSYSSSSVGYLIISKLTDGNYNMTVGFPQDVFPAQTYQLKIKSTDAGYRLQKASGDKWEIIDKLTQNPLPIVNNADNGNETKSTENTESAKSSSGFGALLSKTSNDTTNYQAYAKPNNTEKSPVTDAASNTDNTSAVATMPKKVRSKKEEVTTSVQQKATTAKEDFGNESYESAASRSATQSIVKIGEHSDRRGISLAFVVSSGEKIDTVNTFFPGDSKKSILEDGEEQSVASQNNTAVSPEKQALKKEVDNRKTGSNNPFYKGSSTTTNNSGNLGLFSEDSAKEAASSKSNKVKEDANIDGETRNTTNSKEIFNSTCKSTVSDRDMDKIRKKMIAKSTDDDMIAVARKYIDTKCIYTAQVKELGGLLISDNGRFALYRILYPNVYDGSQFASLKDQLLDKTYKSQFESLIGNQ